MGQKADRVVWRANQQHGRITAAQLIAAGVDRQRIGRWVAAGRLQRVHWGVYAVGHRAPSVHGDYMAAVLASGEGAVLSHRAAAHVLRLLPGAPPPPEVTIATGAGRTRPGIVIHRARLPQLDISHVENIPITIVPRSLLDLAPHLSVARLARACHEAWVAHETTAQAVEACIARNPRKHGAARLRRALAGDVTLSELEDAFLALLRTYGLPRPRTNIDHGGDKVDCHWPDRGLTVELVSYRYHATRRAFERDVTRRRRSAHVAFSYGDVVERGPAAAAELSRLLGQA